MFSFPLVPTTHFATEARHEIMETYREYKYLEVFCRENHSKDIMKTHTTRTYLNNNF